MFGSLPCTTRVLLIVIASLPWTHVPVGPCLMRDHFQLAAARYLQLNVRVLIGDEILHGHRYSYRYSCLRTYGSHLPQRCGLARCPRCPTTLPHGRVRILHQRPATSLPSSMHARHPVRRRTKLFLNPATVSYHLCLHL